MIRDLIYVPHWSFAEKRSLTNNSQNLSSDEVKPPTHIRESLSNILPTHFDFRRPILHHKITNTSKDDDTIDRVPESCIEEFNLYVSTWKGWQGPIPSKDDHLRWEKVNKENTIDGTVSCTHEIPNLQRTPNEFSDDENFNTSTNGSTTTPPPILIAESFSYSLSKIPQTNLMLLYVNHSKEISYLCSKLLIKRKPVEFTSEELCTRLKTTPYRERPHKCYFVHDGEKRPLFRKCDNNRSSNVHYYSFTIVILLLIMQWLFL